MAFGPLSRQASFSLDGTKVAFYSSVLTTGSSFVEKLVVYDRENYTMVQEFPNFQPWAWVDDHTLEALETDPGGSLARIDVDSGKVTSGSGGENYSTAASGPLGKYFVLEDSNGSGFAIRDWQTGEILVKVAHQQESLPDLYWSEDGWWIVAEFFGGPLKVWEVLGG